MSTHPKDRSQREKARRGLLSRHPRFALLVIGALFIIPICAMVMTVAVIILNQVQNAQ